LGCTAALTVTGGGACAMVEPPTKSPRASALTIVSLFVHMISISILNFRLYACGALRDR